MAQLHVAVLGSLTNLVVLVVSQQSLHTRHKMAAPIHICLYSSRSKQCAVDSAVLLDSDTLTKQHSLLLVSIKVQAY